MNRPNRSGARFLQELVAQALKSLERLKHASIARARFGAHHLLYQAPRQCWPRLTKGENEMLAAFRYHLRQFLKCSEDAAQVAGLTSRQHQALLAIKEFPRRQSVTIGELAEQLQIAHE